MSRQSARIVLLSSLLVTLLAPAIRGYGASNLPDLGNPAATALSPHEERAIGRKFIQQARSQLEFLDDPEVNDYITGLGTSLAGFAGFNPQDIAFHVVNDSSLNAFAVPGAHIAVHTGLILAAEAEDELAAVMSHEVVHISQHHLARMVARTKGMSIPATAAILAGVLIGGQAGAAAIATTNASVLDAQLSYTREFEREADALGMNILSDAGFDPHGMPDFFIKLQRNTRILESDAPEYFRTHPLTVNRIAEAESRAEQLPRPERGDQQRFERIKVKLTMEASVRPEDLVDQYQDLVNRDGANQLNRYGLAYSLYKTDRLEEALDVAATLAADYPDERMYTVLVAEVLIDMQRTADAVSRLEAFHERHPDDPIVAHQLADAYLGHDDVEKALTLTRELARANPRNRYFQRMYARAAARAGDTFESHRALGEALVLEYNLTEALIQLNLARDNAGDNYYRQASIDARIQEVETEFRKFADSKY